MAEALLALGEAHLAAGRVDTARRLVSDAMRLAGELREPRVLARAHDALGRTSQVANDYGGAREHWQESLTLYAELGAPQAEQLRAQLAHAQAELGDCKRI